MGNIDLTPGRIESAFALIENTISNVIASGATPIALGGDGSISYPMVRAASKHHQDLVLLHFDAHTDTTVPTNDSPHNAGTQFYRAASEKLIDASRSFHIGIRGTTYAQGGLARTTGLGYRVIPMTELLERGQGQVLAEVKETVGDRPVYLCWDMDVFDPSCAPGVCAPSWGGLSAREGIGLARMLAGLNIVFIDVNTVSPNHDVNGITAFLAAALVYEFMVVLCKNCGLHES